MAMPPTAARGDKMIGSDLYAGARRLLVLGCLCLVVALSGCSDGSNVTLGQQATEADGGNSGNGGQNDNDDGTPDDPEPEDDNAPPTVPVAQTRAGEVYRQEIAVTNADASTDTLVVQVMEPAELTAGESYPLVLHGHGYGGSRDTAPSTFQQRLRDAGYYVISIDQRGFGESSGTVRVMSPDFEGQSLIALLDWAENLEGLARRANGKMKVGSYGGSYGGMFQWLLAGADPEERLRVIAPDIAPFDLTYSLNPNDVIKTGWILALVGGGEVPVLGLATGGDPSVVLQAVQEQVERGEGLRQDPLIYESVVRGALTNNLPDAAANLFRYHSLRYFCETEAAAPQDGFTIGQPDPRSVAPDGLHKIDALLTQGFKDTLFNVNEAVNSYDCLKALGGDVRLLTHQTGHVLPVSIDSVPQGDQLEALAGALVNIPEFQGPGGSLTCGSLDLESVTFAWFEEKLRGQGGAIDAALPLGDDVCLSLDEDDAVAVDSVPRGGEAFELAVDTPAFSGAVTGALGAVLGGEARERLLQSQPLFTQEGSSAVLAGIPTLDITIGEPLDPLDLLDILGPPDSCAVEILPLGCDPIFFFGLGKRTVDSNDWQLIDDQLTPVRGYGQHTLDMTAVAERLEPGDEVGFLIYGFHPQYPISFSRDVLILAATLNGTVELPLIAAEDIVDNDV